ncbi:hypothetical protein [Paramicrobacterium fandaimingii]|uniref:hypothetical protein n=1 Tax=Paramicrobacterium fandaimingii TaxID=2708079 RepID=UPI00141DB123|nr:hypothetical protein [Microbacterium fandaimingii]
MRSSESTPGDAWPHDMQITVDDRPRVLMELLWAREAYDLHPAGDELPPPLEDAPRHATAITVSEAVRADWQREWPSIWGAAVEHAGHESDFGAFTELQKTADGSSERAHLLHLMVGPNWRDEVGDDAFDDDSYREWSRRGSNAHNAAYPTALHDNPEYRDLDALIPAWRAGLTKIVTIPCRGEFARKISTKALLATHVTREISDSYRRALACFA